MRAYLGAAACARVADEMVGVAVVLLVLHRTSSPALAGAMVTAYTLPSIVSGPVLGAWLDRATHRRAILAGGGLLLAAATAGVALTAGRSWVPFALAVLTGFAVPLTSGGYSSLVPHLVPASGLARANALDAAVFNVAAIAGPGLAGVLAAALSPDAAVLAISGLALVGAALTALLPAVPPVPRERSGLLSTVRAGVRHLVRTPPLLGATLTSALSLGSVGVLATALPLRTAELGAGQSAAGLVWAALEVGCLAATLVLGRRLQDRRVDLVVYACTAAYGVAMLTWPLAGSLVVLLALALAAGLVEGLALPGIMATRQRHSPPELLAQVSITGASLKVGGFALGAALGGWLVPAAGPGTAIAVVAAAQLGAAALGWAVGRYSVAVPIRSERPAQ
ncbi:MFS transporter [Actinokineospora soli]|uniref:MFS transporter n=1 Tax=Actinokineospora soli TaxID=1048753 RepID=A0ABW2TSG2_9PSEU